MKHGEEKDVEDDWPWTRRDEDHERRYRLEQVKAFSFLMTWSRREGA